MGSTTYMMFMTVEHLTLPIVDWMESDIWELFEAADAEASEHRLYKLIEKHGRHLHDIVEICDRCNLSALSFLNIDLLENNHGTILQGVELIPVIRALTIVLDELLNTVGQLWCLYVRDSSDKMRMQKAFDSAEIQNIDSLEYYEEEGLFVLIKALLSVANDALVNNKIFVYICFSA